jgi:hypothetical protein
MSAPAVALKKTKKESASAAWACRLHLYKNNDEKVKTVAH